jgi:hypothetical protein
MDLNELSLEQLEEVYKKKKDEIINIKIINEEKKDKDKIIDLIYNLKFNELKKESENISVYEYNIKNKELKKFIYSLKFMHLFQCKNILAELEINLNNHESVLNFLKETSNLKHERYSQLLEIIKNI